MSGTDENNSQDSNNGNIDSEGEGNGSHNSSQEIGDSNIDSECEGNDSYYRSILQYMAHVQCFQEYHSKRMPYCCNKHSSKLFNCRICQQRSKWAAYSYCCVQCSMYFCIDHYIDHVSLFMYCKENKFKIECSSEVMHIKDNCTKKIPVKMLHTISIHLIFPSIIFYFKKNDSKGNIIEQIIGSNNIKSIDLSENGIQDDDIHQFAKALCLNKSLTILNLYNNKIGAVGAKLLVDALAHNKNLVIQLTFNPIGEEGVKYLMWGLVQNKSPTELNFSGNKIDDKCMENIVDAICSIKSLTNLTLRSNEIGSDGVKVIAKLINNKKNLRVLDISYNKIDAKGMKILADALMINTSLTCLYISGNCYYAEGVKILAEALNANHSLTNLDMSGAKIEADGAEILAKALAINNTLLMLKISSNKIGNQGAIAIAQALCVNKTLLSLCIGDNKIKNKGVIKLAEALTINTTIKSFDISYTTLDICKGGSLLARAVEKSTSLTTLNISNCDLSVNLSDSLIYKFVIAVYNNKNITYVNMENNNPSQYETILYIEKKQESRPDLIMLT